jgi:adenylate cyclase
MTKILVVDDEIDLETLIKQRFRQKIRDGIYDFRFARDGVDALEKLSSSPDTEVILCDINMPNMDGLTLLTHLAEANPILKAVMVSAYSDMDNIRTAMNRGAYDFVCKPINFEDLDRTIAKTVNHVLQIKSTIQAIRENNILKMYVDESVLNFMTGRDFGASLLVNEVIEASVLFIDICGFTAMAERTPADIVVKLVNTFFDGMVREIIAQRGYVDKFMGDAVMAVFRGDFHLDRAIDAGLAVRAYMGEATLMDIPNGSPFIPQVSIGVNSGEMISGNIGSSSLRRLDYTVLGDAVNVAQRLQSIAKPGQILVTARTYEQVRGSFEFRRIGEVSLKNKELPVEVYEVLA